MIKFFRTIRKDLISENKTGKYLKYAIGEIILVVIGILIALSINNWNEEIKNRAFEKEILEQIRANLIKDKLTLESIQANIENAMSSTDKVLKSEWLTDERDSLKYWLSDIVRFDRFQPLTNAYEVAKSKGLDLISNKELRFVIGAYYDDEIKRVVKAIEDIEETFKEDWIYILRKDAKEFKFGQFLILKDTDILKGGGEMTNILRINKDNFNGGTLSIKSGIKHIDRIINLLNNE
ncbi:MAG: DUF6090 family protein, partial [Gammaproteobacteria bacterium]|nr:DUF6090 family protein [Gammaproteobacteria bacterium]